MRILFSTGSLKFNPLEEVFQYAGAFNFDGLELYIQHPKLIKNFSAEKINHLQNLNKIKVVSVHMPSYEKYLLMFLRNPVKVGVKVLTEVLQLAENINAENVVVHPFPAIFLLNKVKKNFAKMFEKVKSKNKKNITLSVELLPKVKLKFLQLTPHCIRTPKELLHFCKDNNLKMVLDTTHCLSLGLVPSRVFEICYEVISEIHFSDFYQGIQHLPIGFGEFGYREFFKTLKLYNFSGLITLEYDPLRVPQPEYLNESRKIILKEINGI